MYFVVEREQVKRPPLHPNCRSTLIPYIELRDQDGNVIEDETDRPAAAEDFVQKAKERYEADHPGKKWDDLAATTRDKYYYKEQEIYDKEHGERGASWKHVSSSTTFKDYFENQPDDFKRSWLGEKRYELYKDGKLKFDQLVKPDSGYVVPVSELGQKDGPDMPPTVPSSTKPPGSPKDGDNTSNNPDIEDSAEKNVLEQSDGKGYNSKHGKELERQARDAAEKKSIREQNKGKYTADELKNPNQILTVEDFNAAFEEKKKYFDEIEKPVREKAEQELRELEARKDTITEEERKKEEAKIRLPLDVVVERRRRAILDTIWPDTNPNSDNRKALKKNDNISQDRFVPSAIHPDWYWDTDTKRIVNISGIPSTQSARQYAKADKKVTRRFRQGKDLFGRMLDNMGIDVSPYVEDVEFHGIRDRGYFAEVNLVKTAGRNFLSNDLIILSNKKRRATAATVAHELTHFLESHIPNLRSRVKLLYLTLVDNGNGGLNIQKRIPGSGTAVRRRGRTIIENAEYYRDANIPVPNVYCMRDYGQCEGKELLSVFVTAMIEEPERIVAEYPEYFNAMMDCLKQ